MKPIGVAVVGCGYWGPNIARNVSRSPVCELLGACDIDINRAMRMGLEYRTPIVTDQLSDVVGAKEVELVVVATPSFTHHEIASAAIRAGKHVLVMKPLTTRADQAEELCALASKHGVLVAVDHTFLFTGAVRKMKQLVEDGEIGEIYYFDSVRINLGLIQTDVNVLWDLAPHDVSIMDYLLGQDPLSVSAVGAAHGGSPTENIAYMTVQYEGALLGHVHVNWLAPAKIRRTILGGSNRMLIYDDMEPSEKVRIYDKGFSMENGDSGNGYQMLISYRTGDMHAPKLETREALAVEVDNVAAAIRGRQALVSDGQAGLRVVRILEAAQRSLSDGGASIPIDGLGVVRGSA